MTTDLAFGTARLLTYGVPAALLAYARRTPQDVSPNYTVCPGNLYGIKNVLDALTPGVGCRKIVMRQLSV